MIITRSPLRLSFFGGGTDYPVYFQNHRGATLVASIDKYIYVTVNHLTEFSQHRIGVYYSQVERVSHVNEISHPAVRECLRHLKIERGLEVHIAADLPARSGLGSSSSFTVSLLQALHGLQGRIRSKAQLAEEAIYVEQQLVKERVGNQDQYACALGGLNHLQFSSAGTQVAPMIVPAERLSKLQSCLMLIFTGIQRTAHEIVEEQIQRTENGSNQQYLHKIADLVDQGIDLLQSNRNIHDFGELLHENWVAKKSCSTQISSSQIDIWYDTARKHGAIGGKLLGAGGGGFLLLCVPPEKQENVIAALHPLKQVKFAFENAGATVLFYKPELP